MNTNIPRQGGQARRIMAFARRLIRQIAAIVRECNEAQRRATLLRLSPDMYSFDPDRAPDSYAEFLFRSPVAVRREPRATGAPSSTSSSTRSL
jgi:hypothetical protein